MGFFKKSKPETPKAKAPSRGYRTIRAFAAAQVSRILSPWVWDGGFSNQEITGSLSTLRARSRDMQKNSEHIAKFFRMFEDNVVGAAGFTLKAEPGSWRDPTVIDADAKKFLQYHFWKWSKNRHEVDLAEGLSFAPLCRLVAENWARDGEAFVMLERNAPTAYGLQLRVVRPDACDETLNGPGKMPGTYIRNGIEIDRATRRRVAYYFKTTNEDPGVTYIDRKPLIRVPAEDVLHLFKQYDAAQMRGVPFAHAVLKKAKMLDEFNVAELVAARDEANTIGIFHAPAGQGEDIERLDEDQDRVDELVTASEPGQKFVLNPGWSYDVKTPQHPNREVGNFKNSMLRDIASGLGVEYANLANDWAGVSYSSVRAGTLAERDMWQSLQNEFVEKFVSPVYEAWLASFLTRPASGSYVLTDYDRLVEHTFQPRTWAWVDPMKDINAAKIAVEMGWKTNEEVTAQYGGADFMENCEQLKKEIAAKTAAGILTDSHSVEKGEEKPGKDTDDE